MIFDFISETIILEVEDALKLLCQRLCHHNRFVNFVVSIYNWLLESLS